MTTLQLFFFHPAIADEQAKWCLLIDQHSKLLFVPKKNAEKLGKSENFQA